MRLPIVLLLIASLAGCASVRKGLGEYQKAADKGIGLNTSAASEEAAAKSPGVKDGKKPELPTGLGGDTQHPPYSTPPQG